ncbi:MAG: DNA-3-methyladenine glycosylase [Balneolaceae bacterium]|nr:DNA-3-methyladenine glycosylase [Balneolaceae bacterium]
MNKLPLEFYQRSDVVQISQELLGKVLCTNIGGELTSGIITETEAYCGRGDKACHANNNTRTNRTEIMYRAGGNAYVYLCYGIHHLFNVVTNKKDLADAILIRAIEPVDGIETILERRGFDESEPKLTAGPGRMTQALGITTNIHDGTDLLGDIIWIEDRNISLAKTDITATKRIGVDYAGEDANLPWRFIIKDNKWVSQ